GERAGEYRRGQALPVRGHGERERPQSLQQAAARSFHPEGDLLRERRGVHWVTEGELEHHPLEVGIDRILIELRRRNRGGKGRGGEIEAVALDGDRGGDEALPVEPHAELLAHRPILGRIEDELTVPNPAPGTGDLGGDVDIRRHHYAHGPERRDGGLEHHAEGRGLRVIDGEAGGG